MQPPERQDAKAAENAVVERIKAWAKRPTVADTEVLLEELRENPATKGNHVDAVSRAIAQRHAKEGRVMLLLGRLQLTTGKLADAQQTLVAAGRIDQKARGPYRYLGEVLLRRGDAGRAERMLERSQQLEALGDDLLEGGFDPSDEWLALAKKLKPLQEAQGEAAVVAELTKLLAERAGGGLQSRRPTGSRSLPPPKPVEDPAEDQPTQISTIPDELKEKMRPVTQYGAAGAAAPPVPAAAVAPPPPAMPESARPKTVPPPIPRSVPAPPAFPEPSFTEPVIDRALPSLDEVSDATTLPRGIAAPMVVSDHPTLGSDEALDRPLVRRPPGPPGPPPPAAPRIEPKSLVDDDGPTVARPPQAAQDPSPLPQRLPTNPARALRAEAVTLGDSDAALVEARHLSSPFESKKPNPFEHGPLLAAPSRKEDPGRGHKDWQSDEVLDALARAGIYEPDAAAKAPVAWLSRSEVSRTKRRGAWLYVLLGVLVVGGIAGSLYGGEVYKQRRQKEAEQATQRAELDVRKTGIAALERAEKDLGKAFELDSRTLPGARAWLQDRVLRSYLWPSENRKEGGLASAIERAKTVGITEPELAFARMTLALTSDDTPSAVQLAKTLTPKDARSKEDAWRELAVGWVLERAGDSRSVDRYAHALELDPDLVAAQLALAKLAALAADPDRVTRLLANVEADLVPAREDLLALANLAKTGTATKLGDPAVRRPANIAWIAPALAAADPKADPEQKKKDLSRAMGLSREPGDLTKVGRLALLAGDEATASRAALRALEVSPIFLPARALAARLALQLGRPDDAGRALDGVTAEGDAEVTALRAWLAYERGDYAGLAATLDDPKAGSLDRADLAGIVKPLRWVVAHHASMTAKDVAELKTLGELGELGPLVAFDMAMEAGEVATAETFGKGWGDVSLKPARALRLARLARLTGKGEEADRLSKIAVEQGTVVPSALVERVLVLCGLGKAADALALLGRYSLLAPDEQPWLRAYVTAQSGKVADAKKQVEALKEPDKKAPWPVRRDALLAMAAVADKRAKPWLKELLKERPNDPDVLGVAKVLK
ncbi:MAG: hypothetical protein IPJ34_30700 [Myxococcales bacterium]|nr:hypothetical protein [Myxococcales bacterium]